MSIFRMAVTIQPVGRSRYPEHMSSFSERQGIVPPRSVIQLDDLDRDTRMAIWNVIAMLPTMLDHYGDTTEEEMLTSMWVHHLKNARDERPYDSTIWQHIKNGILDYPWNLTLDMVEDVCYWLKQFQTPRTNKIYPSLVKALNKTLERYVVGYRIIDGKIAPVDSQGDVDAILEALADATPMAGARKHLIQALGHLSDRVNPDYANSIKESISAVEAVCRAITGEHTLGASLKKLEARGLQIHPALEGAWAKLYGWTSDANGIRHGSIAEAEADQALAKYMLVSCSGFVSYVMGEGRKVGLLT